MKFDILKKIREKLFKTISNIIYLIDMNIGTQINDFTLIMMDKYKPSIY